MKKLLFAVPGVATVVAFAAPYLAHAQFVLSTTTEATTNGSFLQTAYDRLINLLTNAGAVTYMVVISLLGVAVWLAVKAIRHVINA